MSWILDVDLVGKGCANSMSKSELNMRSHDSQLLTYLGTYLCKRTELLDKQHQQGDHGILDEEY